MLKSIENIIERSTLIRWYDEKENLKEVARKLNKVYWEYPTPDFRIIIVDMSGKHFTVLDSNDVEQYGIYAILLTLEGGYSRRIDFKDYYPLKGNLANFHREYLKVMLDYRFSSTEKIGVFVYYYNQ